MYICQLPDNQQLYIKRAISCKLYQLGYKGVEHKEILQNGMDSKICDISDAINLDKFYMRFNVEKIGWKIIYLFFILPIDSLKSSCYTYLSR